MLPMTEVHDLPAAQKAVIHQLDVQLTGSRRAAVLQWAQQLVQIRDAATSPARKAREALRVTAKSRVVMALLSSTAGALKDVAWDDRSWSARLGLGAAAITIAAAGGQGAGVAALGTAVGVPLWIVLGAGGSFAGMLIDELSKALPRTDWSESASTTVAEADWEGLEPLPPLRLAEQRALPPGDPNEAPLWQVFKRAYREARARQAGDPSSRD